MKKSTALLIFALVVFAIFTACQNKNVKNSFELNSESNSMKYAMASIINFQLYYDPISAEELQKLSVPILMYHHVRDKDDPNDTMSNYIAVKTQKLESNLELIEKLGYTTITFKDIDTGSIPEKPIILTFDDGYEDAYTNVLPALEKHNMVGVFFIITEKINEENFLKATQVIELAEKGMEIGSHTVTHPILQVNLGNMDAENLKHEISDSKRFLEALIKQPVISFCYPAGKYSQKTVSELAKDGYKYATTTLGLGDASFKNPLELNRYAVYYDTEISSYIK